MKVRALPTWRNPVGDGAKRTLGLAGDEFRVSGIGCQAKRHGLRLKRSGREGHNV